MTQWEIYNFPRPSEAQPHPFVIISSNLICQDKRLIFVNGFICTSIRGNRSLDNYEVAIDEADGMDALTAVACNVMFELPKQLVPAGTSRRGQVSMERRRAIAQATLRGFALNRF